MIRREMDNFKKYYKIGNKYESKNEFGLAIDSYKKALTYHGTSLKCLKSLSTLYDKVGDVPNAIECLNTITTVSTDMKLTVITLNEIGVMHNKVQNFQEALNYFKKTLKYKNDIPEVYLNIGLCYIALKQYKPAETTFLIYFKLRPDNAICKNLADLYFYVKDYDKSIYFYNQMTDLQTNFDHLYNLCFPHLAKKDFRIGLELYENRLKSNSVHPQTGQVQRVEIDIPYWNGVDVCNRLMVIYEQGIGDNIMYYRFLVQLSEKYPDMKITYFCKNTVSHLFKEYENIKVIDDSLPLFAMGTQFDCKAYIMSLPYLLQIDHIHPNTHDYINVSEEKCLYWKGLLQDMKGEGVPQKLNVGFVYKGLLASVLEKNIPLQKFETLTELNINLICLHKKSDCEADLESVSFSDKITMFDLDQDRAFDDTIALLKNLDLLISIDTSIVHLAGVLNTKSLLLLGYVSDWRWFADNTKVWYDSVDILRVTENKELYHIVPQVKQLLQDIHL